MTGAREYLRQKDNRIDWIDDEPVSTYREARSVLLQGATGSGKTPIVAEITHTAWTRDYRVWFVVPRNELLDQAAEHFERWGITHGVMAAGKEESRAFKVHIVSKDTLLRRIERVKNWPDLLIFDEAHLYYRAQLAIIEAARIEKPGIKIIGMTATPERLDGLGLAAEAGGPYEGIVYGPSIPWLTDRGFLAPLRYFAPPIAGLDKISRRGTEYDANQLDELLQKRHVYGDVIGYYQKYGSIRQGAISTGVGNLTTKRGMGYHKGRPALIFCRSVKSAYETAERFTQAGYLFFCIEGELPKGRRKELIDALKDGRIDGLTNCDLATYGLDVPRVEYGASIRPTLSRALYFQMVGRILRPFTNKEEALFFDHANLVEEHTAPSSPGIPLFYLPSLTWNFAGLTRRERAPSESSAMRLCPMRDYQYCADPACAGGCKMDPATASKRQALEVLDVPLEERTPVRPWTDLQPEERRDVQDRIGAATDEWLSALAEDPPRIAPGPVGALLRIAEELGRSAMWVYHFLTEKDDAVRAGEKKMTLGEYRRMARAVNVPLLYEIGRQARTKEGKPYKNGWAWMKKRELEEQMEEARKEGATA